MPKQKGLPELVANGAQAAKDIGKETPEETLRVRLKNWHESVCFPALRSLRIPSGRRFGRFGFVHNCSPVSKEDQ